MGPHVALGTVVENHCPILQKLLAKVLYPGNVQIKQIINLKTQKCNIRVLLLKPYYSKDSFFLPLSCKFSQHFHHSSTEIFFLFCKFEAGLINAF